MLELNLKSLQRRAATDAYRSFLYTVERLDATGVRAHKLALGGVDLTSPAGKMTKRTQAGLTRSV